MERKDIEERLARQRAHFATGATFPAAARRQALRDLLRALEEDEGALLDALRADLGKSHAEGYMCELALVKSELRHMLRHLGRYMRERRVHTPLAQSVSRSYVKPVPYGTVLIMSPWNYPLLLSLDPLIDALAAGNTAIVKPSAYAPATADALERLIGRTFPPELVTVVTGGRAENASLLELPFDYIFFTGSKDVGREVMRRAAERLIPVTLELGGKSPCIVDETADLALAARRIVFGKFVNCGQTCVAPDYLYCPSSIRDELVRALRHEIEVQYGADPLANGDYGSIVNRKHFSRLCRLLDSGHLAYGGRTQPETLRIAPTILTDVTWDDAVMGEEIFGPILPVLTYESLPEAIEAINGRDTPLALYLFSSDKATIRLVTERVGFGGGCINDTLIHLATSAMGFGGLGPSGMGAYHGKRGFDTFTHEKSLVDKKTFLDLPMRYQPYTKLHQRMIRWFVR